MSALTRWVLARKKTVVISWIVLTIAGVAAAGPASDVSTSEGGAVLDDVRDTAHAQGSDVTVGGFPAVNDDFISAVYGNFPLMLALIAVITFVLLARAFRSLLLPLKAVILNVISVAAAWGVLVLVWQEGFGSEAIWDIEATGASPLGCR